MDKMKILVIGSGGREHALVWKIVQSKKVAKIFCAPGNPGTAEMATNIPIAVDSLDELLAFAKKEKINLTVVGPEIPLILGIADLFEKNGLHIVGPSKKAARLEGSKIFAKKLLLWNKIPTADFACFDDYAYAKEYLHTQKYPLVIKADGQCAGKGVMVCKKENEAQTFLKELMLDKVFGPSGNKIVIEECLIGPEVSFMVATDGNNFSSFLPSQDHKPVFDRDKGPNTGGMGAYTPVPWVYMKLMHQIENEIVSPLLKAMKDHGNPYKGILYPGLILTKDGPKVLEFNCRFGDPETQPLMVMLTSDIIDVFEAIIKNKVNALKMKWHKGAAVCTILASKGYPGKYEKEKEINGFEKIKEEKDTFVFHAGTKTIKDKLITDGGRVLGITGRGKNLKDAMRKVYNCIGQNGIHFSGMQYRKDIGKKGLKIS
jgi:phosphoribosylamine---glycine ligase